MSTQHKKKNFKLARGDRLLEEMLTLAQANRRRSSELSDAVKELNKRDKKNRKFELQEQAQMAKLERQQKDIEKLLKEKGSLKDAKRLAEEALKVINSFSLMVNQADVIAIPEDSNLFVNLNESANQMINNGQLLLSKIDTAEKHVERREWGNGYD